MRQAFKTVSKYAALTAIVAGLSVPLVSYAEKSDTYQMLNLFGEVFERVRIDYVEPVKDTDLIEAAINGMLTSLDPHSSYMNEKAFQEMQVQTKGEFGGLGIEVTMDNGLVKVVSPIDDTPAFKAGIKTGDYVSEIDGAQVLGLTLSEAVEKMRGKVGTKVTLTVLREGENEPLKIEITRAVIKIQAVRSRAEGDIGYVRISSFSEQTFDTMKSEIAKLKKDMGKMKGLVLDLRNNPGGLLDQAVAVSDAFLERGEIVSTRERNPANTRRYSATAGDLLKGLPIVVLINSGSASASEIVAGALQDHNRAVILGTQSFGKGSVQTVIPLKDHGAMRLTTSRYYTPSGTSIQAKGITPNIVVEQARIEPVKAPGFRLEAELRGRLKNDDELKKEKEAAMPQAAAPDKEKDQKTARPGELEEDEDFQLARALDLLRGLAVYRSAQTN